MSMVLKRLMVLLRNKRKLQKTEAKPTCGTCRWRDPGSNGESFCLFNPPTSLPTNDGSLRSAFPVIRLTWKCSRWEAK